MDDSLLQEALRPFEFQVERKSFQAFLEAYMDQQHNDEAPIPPWVTFTQLPALQQRSEMLMKKTKAADGSGGDATVGGAKRRARVVFDETSTNGGGGTAVPSSSASSSGAAATNGSSTTPDQHNSAHRQAVVKKMKATMDQLHLLPNALFTDAAVVRDYFAVKALVEYLPMRSVVVNTPANLLQTPTFLSKVREIVDHLHAVGVTQQASHSARFKRLALRRAGGTGGAEGAVMGHHFGARHSFQLFIRSVLKLSATFVAGTVQLQATALSQRRSTGSNKEETYATLATNEIISYARSQGGAGSKSVSSFSRYSVLSSVEENTGMPHRVVPMIHLQSHGFQKDTRLLGRGGLASDAASSTDGLSSAGARSFKRGASMGQMSAHSSSRDLRSNHSSGVFDDNNSDTRSVVSAATHSGGGGAGGSSNSNNAPYVCPPWQLKQLDFWIALKGIVFRINTETKFLGAGRDPRPIPAGRATYYRIVLLPIFSGRDCTRTFAWSCCGCSLMDFMGIEEYVHAWRGKLVAAATAEDATLSQQHPSSSKASGTKAGVKQQLDSSPASTTLSSGTRLGDSPHEWPLAVRQHVDRIFSLFMEDFDVVGELQNGEDLWF
ncbi:Hypothetical protein, putative [Bodo saltans]|uniref:Uncharacterized protein n=1 Tax=Bodo saltans TaxID=75058 RepID=A0A0S4K014_BODSA|nr:Hypothetical protein, putative [Bodo saltans]|eukprot:CUG94183.1 Hypothetical protein, putative [Bodo saltans]